MNEPPYYLDISGLKEPREVSSEESELRDRPWVGIRFDCCGVYTRVYCSADATAYRGKCPRCGRSVTLRVGENGTSARFFIAE